MVLKRELDAVADVLSDKNNADKTAEEFAEEIVRALDAVRAKSNRLAVIANYGWTGEAPTLAVLGPFSTRSRALARAAGEAMAGTTQGGHGKWLAVPAYASVSDAWEAVRPSATEAAERRLEQASGGFFRDNPTMWAPLAGDWATCCCGLQAGSYCLVHKKVNPKR